MKKVTAAILFKNGRILIAKRKAGEKLANFWEFPGGKIEDGETPEGCLKRELKEELGIEVWIGEFFGESIYHYEQGSIHLLGYWTTWVKGDMEPKVHSEVKWVTPEELDQYIFAPADIPFVKKLRSEGIGV